MARVVQVLATKPGTCFSSPGLICYRLFSNIYMCAMAQMLLPDKCN